MTSLSKILESAVLNEESKNALMEAWDQKITEAREEIASELREEFATRYEHDKNLIIEASDKFIKESIQDEFKDINEDKAKIREARVAIEKTKAQLAEAATTFIKTRLAEEMKQFKSERKEVSEGLLKMQSFVQKQLSEEFSDFNKDKKALAESRVEFEKNKAKELTEVKKRFVESASKISEKIIRESIKSEMKQLKTDLQESKKKIFGMKLFEAFAAEFMSSHYNEDTQVSKLGKLLESTKAELAVLKESVSTKDKLLTEAKNEAKKMQAAKERADIMNDLLSPLGKKHKKVMQQLLESTETSKLQEGYQKYISMVLKEDSVNVSEKSILTESANTKVIYDGNRPFQDDSTDAQAVRIRKLSGLIN